jgi:capsular polysaccharide transport system permease protein
MTASIASAIQTPTLPRPTFWRCLAINLRVIGALMMREGTMKYGHENLGFFWVMGEPLLLTVGVMAMWTVSGQTHGHGIGVVPFALSGYTMITLWRHLSGKQVHAIRASTGLLFHRNITLLDVLLAKCLLEVIGILTAFFVAYTPLVLIGVLDPMPDPLLFAGGYFLQAWFSLAFGLNVAALSEIFEMTEQILPPMLYITIPFTGVFSMAAWLPEQWRIATLWSPLVTNVEMVRAGMFPVDTVTYYYPMYTVWWSLGLTAVALPLLQHARRYVTVS